MIQSEINEVIDLHIQGFSSRKICEKLGKPATCKSTVNSLIKKFKADETIYSGINSKKPKEEQPVELTSGELDTLCDSKEFSVSNLAKRLRSAQRTNTQLRKIQNGIFDAASDSAAPSIEDIVKSAASTLSKLAPVKFNYKPSKASELSTLEVLFSDLQIGKVSRYYNTEVAKKALKLYGEGILKAIEERKGRFNVERIVFAMIGDVCEDHSKHGVGSAISTDTGLSEQLHDAIEGVWASILSPLALLGLPMDVICVVGNHASSTHKGMGTFKEGRYSYDFVVHKTLESFCRIAGYNNVTFNIPDGTFGTMQIYNKHVIYEHGYHNNMSEKGMVDQMRKRGAQLQLHPTYWRQGDKHHSIVYGQGEQILNGAFFGVDNEGLEYSGVLGYNSIPSQTIIFHVDERVMGKGTVKEILHVQLAITDKPAS